LTGNKPTLLGTATCQLPFIYMADEKAIDNAQRYIATQRNKIHIQAEFVRLLESNAADVLLVRMEKRTLREMGQSLDVVVSRLRHLMHGTG
jgi:hypothetical protein